MLFQPVMNNYLFTTSELAIWMVTHIYFNIIIEKENCEKK